eukprot:CAMPEP_0172486048 /NCGR_PEP_ID=MMETSP1066-20121228/14424_1 /TAXON_ID=671091 /ORGANISM="Coscinodiscus wailesii, Strain CCMP2513" /LENGTH=276 /DNA_ID=CAMNT_0013251741 /DNA_START=181 /DNA_END=1008 /DNA_ORIENTATION=+
MTAQNVPPRLTSTAVAAAVTHHGTTSGVRSTASATIIQKLNRGDEITPDDVSNLRRELSSSAAAADESSIPYLTRRNVPSLLSSPSRHPLIVRHMGMVQDIFDPEYYLATTRDGRCAKYNDACHDDDDDDEEEWDVVGGDVVSRLAERQAMAIVPLPFTSPWYRSATSLEGRGDDVTMTSDDGDHDAAARSQCDGARGTKRCVDGVVVDDKNNELIPSKKRQVSFDEDTTTPRDDDLVVIPTPWSSSSSGAGFMTSDPTQIPIVAKFYDGDAPRLN